MRPQAGMYGSLRPQARALPSRTARATIASAGSAVQRPSPPPARPRPTGVRTPRQVRRSASQTRAPRPGPGRKRGTRSEQGARQQRSTPARGATRDHRARCSCGPVSAGEGLGSSRVTLEGCSSAARCVFRRPRTSWIRRRARRRGGMRATLRAPGEAGQRLRPGRPQSQSLSAEPPLEPSDSTDNPGARPQVPMNTLIKSWAGVIQ
jgi:hypothetical protein